MVIGAAGDIAAQYLTRDRADFRCVWCAGTTEFRIDWFRTFRIGVPCSREVMSSAWISDTDSFLISGMSLWRSISRYNALDTLVKSTGPVRAVNKMAIDQALFVPCCQILFSSGNSILENPRGQPQAAISKLRECLPISLAVPSPIQLWSDELRCVACLADYQLQVRTTQLPGPLSECGAVLLEYFPLPHGKSERESKAVISRLLTNKRYPRRLALTKEAVHSLLPFFTLTTFTQHIYCYLLLLATIHSDNNHTLSRHQQ